MLLQEKECSSLNILEEEQFSIARLHYGRKELLKRALVLAPVCLLGPLNCWPSSCNFGVRNTSGLDWKQRRSSSLRSAHYLLCSGGAETTLASAPSPAAHDHRRGQGRQPFHCAIYGGFPRGFDLHRTPQNYMREFCWLALPYLFWLILPIGWLWGNGKRNCMCFGISSALCKMPERLRAWRINSMRAEYALYPVHYWQRLQAPVCYSRPGTSETSMAFSPAYQGSLSSLRHQFCWGSLGSKYSLSITFPLYLELLFEHLLISTPTCQQHGVRHAAPNPPSNSHPKVPLLSFI